MACNNRLLHLPWDLFFKITNHLTIFDLNNMEKSGLFELDEKGISDVIQAAFERLRHIYIRIFCDDLENDEIIKRCRTGLRSLIVEASHQGSFLHYAHRFDKEFGSKLAASCPNIERFHKYDYYGFRGYDSIHAYRDYIRNIDVSKLVQIRVIDLAHDDLQILFTPSLKSVIFCHNSEFIELMEELSVSRPNFGTSIERLTISGDIDFNSDIIRKQRTYFPNLKTMKVKNSGIKCVYNREQINRPDFVHQLKLFSKYDSDDLPYINEEYGEKFDLSSIIKYHRYERPLDINALDQLTNLQSLELTGTDMMSLFSDYLSETSFKSLKEISFTHLNLNAENLTKFEKIFLTGRFFIRNLHTTASGVQSALIPLLNKFCRNRKIVHVELQPPVNISPFSYLSFLWSCVKSKNAKLSAVEIKLLEEVSIAYSLMSEMESHGDPSIIVLYT